MTKCRWRKWWRLVHKNDALMFRIVYRYFACTMMLVLAVLVTIGLVTRHVVGDDSLDGLLTVLGASIVIATFAVGYGYSLLAFVAEYLHCKEFGNSES